MEATLRLRADRRNTASREQLLQRVRREFEEMPCLRVTCDQARLLFGLPAQQAAYVLGRLERDGFLGRTPRGEYHRRDLAP